MIFNNYNKGIDIVTVEYPQLNNYLIYKDKNNICYAYAPKKVNCDKNESKLKDFPLSK